MFFSDADDLNNRISSYFKSIEGSFHMEAVPAKGSSSKTIQQKVWDTEPGQATLTGLALSLGFISLKAYTAYQETGEFADVLKRASLLIEAAYEKRLLQQAPTGAMFALKCFGWTDKEKTAADYNTSRTMEIKIIESGPEPASTESEVII